MFVDGVGVRFHHYTRTLAAVDSYGQGAVETYYTHGIAFAFGRQRIEISAVEVA